jgi:hypothetical protein
LSVHAVEREKLLQLEKLNEFLAKITALDSIDKRFDKYVEVYRKLHEEQRTYVATWSTHDCKNGKLGSLMQEIANLNIGNPDQPYPLIKERPISMGQLPFFKAFNLFIQKNLRDVAVDRRERRNCPPISRQYNNDLIIRIDQYLDSLHFWMNLQVEADAAHDGGSDGEYEEKYIRRDIEELEHKMTTEFLRVILFLFAVPQEIPRKVRLQRFQPDELIPPLEPSMLDMDVTWMNEDCRWYQHNVTFMTFLTDYAVIALMQSYYSFSKSVTEICESYRNVVPGYIQADVFVEHVSPQEVLHEDTVATIAGIVRERSHNERHSHHAPGPAENIQGGAATSRALLELQALIE